MGNVVPIPYPQPIPFPRLHRCAHPYWHSLVVVGLLAAWIWFSLRTRGTWGLTLARYLDPHTVGYGLPIAVLTELAWAALLPGGALVVSLVGMWRCTGARPHLASVVGEALEPPQAASPVLIERVMLNAAQAAQHGLPPGAIVERVHYR